MTNQPPRSAVSPFSSPNFQRNLDAPGNHGPNCAVCGKAVKAPRHWVTVHHGGGAFAREGDLVEDSMGQWPVGPDCAKLLPPAVLFAAEADCPQGD